MQLTSQQFKHCDVLHVSGRVDSYTAIQLQEAMDAITGEGRYKIVLDCKDLDFMSSAGLRVLINTQKICKRYNRGEVMLAALPENIYTAFDLAGFTSLFKIYKETLEAVGDF